MASYPLAGAVYSDKLAELQPSVRLGKPFPVVLGGWLVGSEKLRIRLQLSTAEDWTRIFLTNGMENYGKEKIGKNLVIPYKGPIGRCFHVSVVDVTDWKYITRYHKGGSRKNATNHLIIMFNHRGKK